MDTAPKPNMFAVEALAESWASIDGKIEAFRNGKGMDNDDGGYFEGYICDSHEMISRLRTRGFDIVPILAKPTTTK